MQFINTVLKVLFLDNELDYYAFHDWVLLTTNN